MTALYAFTEFGSEEWSGIVLFALVLFFASKRWWPSIVILVIAVPSGMLVLLVGFSRIALGAHFLTDVLAAIFLGITWLILCTVLETRLPKELLHRRFQDRLRRIAPEVHR